MCRCPASHVKLNLAQQYPLSITDTKAKDEDQEDDAQKDSR